MSLNDHITDKADWRCEAPLPGDEQCARWNGHTLYVTESKTYNHMCHSEVISAFMVVLGMYEGYGIEQVEKEISSHRYLARLWHLRATMIYNSKVYIQGVDEP